ncbi:unnamed protein product [Prorocentrum cordatum]|uniref:Uncharacterized protein n=1 Tax=Prorocentrum cordatum TaxID=2364126 RepID=A0ABN9PU01_9DINO|nr:unnamed protein product [Polarella glacialis]
MPPGQAMRPVLPRPFRPGLLPPGVLSKAAGCNPQAAGGSPVAVRKAKKRGAGQRARGPRSLQALISRLPTWARPLVEAADTPQRMIRLKGEAKVVVSLMRRKLAVAPAEREDGALSPISPASEMPISPASEITDSGAQPSAQPEGAKNGSTTEVES